jgi:hypothetical protein
MMMASPAMPPTTPPAMGPALVEPPGGFDVELLLDGCVTGVTLYVGEMMLTISVLVLASHWQGNMEKFFRS